MITQAAKYVMDGTQEINEPASQVMDFSRPESHLTPHLASQSPLKDRLVLRPDRVH